MLTRDQGGDRAGALDLLAALPRAFHAQRPGELERLNADIKRRAQLVGIFPHDASLVAP